MGKREYRTHNDPSQSNFGDHYPVSETEYPYGARARGSGVALPPQTRSVDSMKAPPSKSPQFNAGYERGWNEAAAGRRTGWKHMSENWRRGYNSAQHDYEKKAHVIVPEPEKCSERAMVKDEADGVRNYLRMAQEAEKEGRHEDAAVFRRHAREEARHLREDKQILKHPDDYWMAEAFKNRGALHRQLGIPADQRIGKTHLEEIVNTPDGGKWHGHTVTPLMKKRAQAGLNAM